MGLQLHFKTSRDRVSGLWRAARSVHSMPARAASGKAEGHYAAADFLIIRASVNNESMTTFWISLSSGTR